MAFMMPVFKNDYDIYASKSRRSSSSASIPRSRRSTRSDSNAPSLSCSPGSDVDERLSAVAAVEESVRRASRRTSRNDNRSRSGSQFTSTNSCPPSPKSASQTSLHKFHSRLVDKLKRTLRIKGDDAGESSSSKNAVAAASS